MDYKEQESSFSLPEQATPEEKAYIEGLEDAAQAIETAISTLESEDWKTPLYETVLNSVRVAEAQDLLRRILALIDAQTAELIMKYSAAGGQTIDESGENGGAA